MQFDLLTLTGPKFSGEVSGVTLITAWGQIGILPHHEALSAQIMAGPIVVHSKGGKQEVFATFGGLLEVTSEGTRVLADEAEHADDIIQAEVSAALNEAIDLKSRAKDKHELVRAQELVDRQTVRLGVAKLHRRHRPDRSDHSR